MMITIQRSPVSDFEHVDELNNYDIYHRIDPNATKDPDDDNDDDDDP